MVRGACERIQSCRQVAVGIGLPTFAKLSRLIAMDLVDDIGEEELSIKSWCG